MRRSDVAVEVTLTSANTNYNLLSLINAVITAEPTNTDLVTLCPGAARVVEFQAHPGIDGVGGNTNDILVGDGLLSATRFGFVLTKGQSYTDRADHNVVDVGNVYVRSAGAGQKLNVRVTAA